MTQLTHSHHHLCAHGAVLVVASAMPCMTSFSTRKFYKWARSIWNVLGETRLFVLKRMRHCNVSVCFEILFRVVMAAAVKKTSEMDLSEDNILDRLDKMSEAIEDLQYSTYTGLDDRCSYIEHLWHHLQQHVSDPKIRIRMSRCKYCASVVHIYSAQ